MQYINFIQDPNNNFLGQTSEYLKLCGVSIVVAIVIGVVLGALVSRNAFLAFLAINLSGLMRAIPIIAALFIIFFITNQLGFLPSIIALIVLGIPPILINTYTGIRGVDPAIIDAAKGIRTSAVQIIATATLAAFIGGGGYGDYIVDGISVFNYTELIVGAVSVAVLAMLVEVFMSWLQHVLTPEGLKVQEQAAAAKA